MASRARAVTAALAVWAIATVTGCAADADVADPPAEPTTPAPVTDDTASPDVTASGPECLIGSWELRNETFEAALVTMMRDNPDVPAELLSGRVVAITGTSSLRFGAGGDYGAWQDEFTMTIGSGGERMQHTQSSADVAQYRADGESVHVHDFQQLFAEATMTLGDSMTVSMPHGNASMASISFFGHTSEVPTQGRELLDGTARYTCRTDLLTLHADGFPSAAEFVRVADITRE